jgi:hypothetical protein
MAHPVSGRQPVARFGRTFDDISVAAFDTLDANDTPLPGSDAPVGKNAMMARATGARPFRCCRAHAGISRTARAKRSPAAARRSTSGKR